MGWWTDAKRAVSRNLNPPAILRPSKWKKGISSAFDPDFYARQYDSLTSEPLGTLKEYSANIMEYNTGLAPETAEILNSVATAYVVGELGGVGGEEVSKLSQKMDIPENEVKQVIGGLNELNKDMPELKEAMDIVKRTSTNGFLSEDDRYKMMILRIRMINKTAETKVRKNWASKASHSAVMAQRAKQEYYARVISAKKASHSATIAQRAKAEYEAELKKKRLESAKRASTGAIIAQRQKEKFKKDQSKKTLGLITAGILLLGQI